MMPNRIKTRIGSTRANSTAAAPASRRGSPARARNDDRRPTSRRITVKASDEKALADAREIRGAHKTSRASERGGQDLGVRSVGAPAQGRGESLTRRIDEQGAAD